MKPTGGRTPTGGATTRARRKRFFRKCSKKNKNGRFLSVRKTRLEWWRRRSGTDDDDEAVRANSVRRESAPPSRSRTCTKRRSQSRRPRDGTLTNEARPSQKKPPELPGPDPALPRWRRRVCPASRATPPVLDAARELARRAAETSRARFRFSAASARRRRLVSRRRARRVAASALPPRVGRRAARVLAVRRGRRRSRRADAAPRRQRFLA